MYWVWHKNPSTPSSPILPQGHSVTSPMIENMSETRPKRARRAPARFGSWEEEEVRWLLNPVSAPQAFVARNLLCKPLMH